MTQDSIFDDDQGWQSLAKAVRDRGRDWLYLRVASEPFDPYRNWHSLSYDEQQLREQLWRWDAYSGNPQYSVLEREMRRYHPAGAPTYNGIFGSLFGSAF